MIDIICGLFLLLTIPLMLGMLVPVLEPDEVHPLELIILPYVFCASFAGFSLIERGIM